MAKGTHKDEVNWTAKWSELHEAIGAAVTAWSDLEHALAKSFALTLDLPEERSERMFFAMHTFSAKHDLLWEAIKAKPLNPGLEATQQAIFKSACKKADLYAPTRNKLAHSRPVIGTHGSIVLGGLIVPNVISAQALDSALEKGLTVTAIREAARSFNALARLLKAACEETDQASLETLLQQVRSLAPCPILTH